MGGVINIITRKVPSEWGGEIRMDSTIQESSKSGDIYQGNFYLAGPIKNDLLGLSMAAPRSAMKTTSTTASASATPTA